MFTPISLMKKIELIKTDYVSSDTISKAESLIKEIAKEPILIKTDYLGITKQRLIYQFLILKYLLSKRVNQNKLNISKNLNDTFKHLKYILGKFLRKILIKGYYLAIWLNKFIDTKLNKKNLMINIGGGYFRKKKWRVLDTYSVAYSYPSVFIDYDFNLSSERALPFEDNTVRLFYSSHTFEHIPQKKCQFIFNEIYRCLKRGGAIRLTMPDFDLAYIAYGENNENFFKHQLGKDIHRKFLDFFANFISSKISPKEFSDNYDRMKKEDFANYYSNKAIEMMGKVQVAGHLNWWNYEKVENMLKKAGFNTIYRSSYQKSRFSEMRDTKNKKYFDSTFPDISLFVEAIKE